MPLYDWKCECGMKNKDVSIAISDIGSHEQICPGCGSAMTQDYSDYRPPTIFGELPTTGFLAGGYYDENLGTYVHGKRQREEAMKRKGLEDFHMDPEQSKMHEEVKYIQKHGKDKEIRPAVDKISGAVSRKRTDRAIDKVLDPVVERVVATVPD